MQTTQIVTFAAAFLSFALFAVAIGQLVSAFFNRYERMWSVAQRKNDSRLAALADLVKQVLVIEGLKLRSIERMRSKLQVNVVRGASALTADEYLGQTLFEGLLILLIAGVACLFLFGPASLIMPLVLAIAWIYFIRPSLIEGDAVKRSRAIYRRIPYALDLAVLVLQAGGTLREALEVAAARDDPLAQEMRAALKEMDSGATQSAALRNMSNRVGLDSLDSIVMAIIRGLETGAPMAQTLATQAELFRERRLQELEKLAVEAPTKMTFPNMLVMLSVLVIILGPVLVKISRSGLI
jgi:tight adherence protein C